MKALLTTTAMVLFVGTSSFVSAQEHNCGNAVTCNNASVNKSDTTNTQNFGDHLNNTYSPDSASASAQNSVKIGDNIAQGGTGGNSSAHGNLSNNDNKSSASNNLSNQQLGVSTNKNVLGQSIGDTTSTSVAKGGDSKSVATGGSVTGSGNSKNKNVNNVSSNNENKSTSSSKNSNKNTQGQKQSQSNKATNSSNTQVGGQSTNIDSRNQSSYTYKEAANTAFAAGIYGESTASCVKVSGIGAGMQTVGAGWTFNIRNDREAGNCIVNLRTMMVADLAGSETALLYLAQNDPALWAAMVAQGKIVAAPRERSNPLGQSLMPQPNAIRTQMPDGPVCHIKAGTTRTVVTNYPNKMECARKLGLAR